MPTEILGIKNNGNGEMSAGYKFVSPEISAEEARQIFRDAVSRVYQRRQKNSRKYQNTEETRE